MKLHVLALGVATVATLVATLSTPAQARRGSDDHSRGHDDRRGDDICTSTPQSGWQPLAGFAEKARKLGYDVVKLEISGSCYEVYGRRNGALYELYFNPATGELVRVEQDDRR